MNALTPEAPAGASARAKIPSARSGGGRWPQFDRRAFAGIAPAYREERVALQTHLPLPADFGERVVLQFLPEGYSGQAPIGNGELNLCLVSKPGDMPTLRAWAEMRFGLKPDHAWRTITPLRRAAIPPSAGRLFLVGDAARVVEPFTGEGIYYALRSGELAAEAIRAVCATAMTRPRQRRYAAAHEKLYRGRLWVNRLARAAVLSPRLTSLLLRGGSSGSVARGLTTKIVRLKRLGSLSVGSRRSGGDTLSPCSTSASRSSSGRPRRAPA